jgi:putative chitinase
MLTGAILRRIEPAMKPERAASIAKLLNEICPTYGISTPTVMHEFLANVMHESNSFSNYSESLNYSVDALLAKFGRHRITAAQAQQFGRIPGRPANQQAIANILYGGAWGKKNLGNINPNDGWQFRGAGPIQITGRRNFVLFTLYMKMVHGEVYTLTQMADLLRNNDRIAVHSACWVFAVAKKLIPYAERDCMRTVVRRINGGFMGMDDRTKKYELAKQHIA